MSIANLSKSCFYPACGVDFQPLARFSHICDTFVYVDWNCNATSVEESVRRLKGGLELQADPEVVDREELGPYAALPPGFVLEPETYQNRMRNSSAFHGPWARRFRLLRRFSGIQRNLTLLYIAAEGLATYTAMYGQHDTAPLILCTIQSSGGGWTRLEEPGGAMERLIECYPRKPLAWLRGRWASLRDASQRGAFLDQFAEQGPDGNAGHEQAGEYQGLEDADEFGPDIFDENPNSRWNRLIQNYAGWRTGSSIAVVKGFGRDGSNFQLREQVDVAGARGAVQLKKSSLTVNEVNDFDGCFLTPPLAMELGVAQNANVRVWDRSSASLVDFLGWIEAESEKEGWQRVAAVPVGYEDEGEYLQQWIQDSRPPRRLEIRFRDELDFADLRGWPPKAND